MSNSCQTKSDPITVRPREAARLKGVSLATIYRDLAAGKLHAVKAGNLTLIRMDSLRTHLASLPTATFRQQTAA